MKLVVLSVFVITVTLLSFSAWAADFLPKANGDNFGLEYGESIALTANTAPNIDGNLVDWKWAVWIAFDSEKELLRGKGSWKGVDDLSVVWSTMYDDENFYFAAAVRDDLFAPSADPGKPWTGDTIFLYIDWDNAGAVVSSKPSFAKIKGKAQVADFSGGKNPDVTKSEIAVVANKDLGKGGMIYEVAMTFKSLTNVKISPGLEIGFTPGYEEGTDNPEKRAGLVFMDWNGVNPDQANQLGKLKFSAEAAAIEPTGKLTTTWGKLKGSGRN
jgi:hypothetical protein